MLVRKAKGSNLGKSGFPFLFYLWNIWKKLAFHDHELPSNIALNLAQDYEGLPIALITNYKPRGWTQTNICEKVGGKNATAGV